LTEELQLPEPGELIGAKYQVERLLGMGGMGAVYEATHRVTGKRFALKLLLPELTTHEDVVKRFIREAQVAGRFQHPNVVEVYDVGEHGSSMFMVMELLRGESLALRLEREGKLPVDVACKVLMECLDGVAAAHAAGIIHRDLKPANIFLCTTRAGFVAKVLDFGISKLTEAPGIPKATTTDTGTVMGTPFYMAPEQLRSKGVDHRVDIYALGVTLYESLSGRQPYAADNYPDLVIKIWTETPPALDSVAPETPVELADIIAKAMARSPQDRFESAESMASALEPFASGKFVSKVDPRARPERGAGGTLVAPRPAGSSVPPVKHATKQVEEADVSLEPVVRAVQPPPLPAVGSGPKPSRQSPLRDAGSGPRWVDRSSPPPAAPSGSAAMSASARRRKGSLETTLRTSTPFASESLESARVRNGAFARPVVRWTIAACLIVVAAYGIWQGIAGSEDEPVASPSDPPAPNTPSQLEAASPSRQAVSQPAAAQPEAEGAKSFVPSATKAGSVGATETTPALGSQDPAKLRATGASVPAPLQPPAARRGAPVVPRDTAARVGEAAAWSDPARGSQPSAARPRPELPAEDEPAEARPERVQRPNPAIDRTQF
jgi:serine/threonine protein kinase